MQKRCQFIQIADQIRVLNQYGELSISREFFSDNSDFKADLKIGEVSFIPSLALEIQLSESSGFVRNLADKIGNYPVCASIDFEKANGKTLTVRSIREGDRMRPFGMKGTRKLQDILVDEKVPREMRRNLLLVECDGEIVWLPGYRVSEDWKVREKCAFN